MTQLDLFLDSQEVILVNDVLAGLAARDVESAGQALERLRESRPHHTEVASLARLHAALQVPSAALTRAGLLDRIEDIERSLVPLAERFLGEEAAAFLLPVWQRLSLAARSLPFDDAQPRAHCAWLCQQYEDWGAAAAAILAVPGWEVRPLLRYWLALARHHLGDTEEAVTLWLPLCWSDPPLFASHASTLPSVTVRQAWSAFERASALEDALDGPDRTPWFPAWMLLRHRGLARLFDATAVPEVPTAAHVFSHLVALLPLERGVLSDELIRRRRALQQVSHGFFRYYLDVVAQGRP